MPRDKVDAGLAAIEANWFIGGNSGFKFSQMLRDKLLLRHDIDQMNTAMEVKSYWHATEEKRQYRDSVRATMLAYFLVKGTTVDQAPNLTQRLLTLNKDELKRSFRSCFPAFNDNNNRAQWNPALLRLSAEARGEFLNPDDWTGKAIPQYKIVVHTVKWDSIGDLLTNPVATMCLWDAISMSLISTAKPQVYSNFGLVMSVPANNILVTSVMDAWFDNRAGGVSSEPGGKAMGLSMGEHIMEKNVMVGGLLSPDEVLRLQNTNEGFMQHNTGTAQSPYNEIVVTGRIGVRLPQGVTGMVGVAGLFMQTKTNGTLPTFYTSAAQRAPTDQVLLRMTDAARDMFTSLYYIPNAALDNLP